MYIGSHLNRNSRLINSTAVFQVFPIEHHPLCSLRIVDGPIAVGRSNGR